jgi:SAM-dependent methyltransferase
MKNPLEKFSILHPTRVAGSLYWNNRRALRIFLGIKRPTVNSVLSDGVESAFTRYLRVCLFYHGHLGRAGDISGQTVCEIGCGNCLASADLLLGMGASHVDLIETLPIVVDEVQKEVLEKFSSYQGLPNRNEILGRDGKIDGKKATVVPQYLEHIEDADKYQVMLSYDVLEHVSDVAGFFRNCRRLLHPGGIMIHKIDLSGHQFFEDPLPPLDFQTYPDWLYKLMNLKRGYAMRRLQGEFLDAIRRMGFSVEEVGILRAADEDYVELVRPKLRSQIRRASTQELKVLDWYVIARKPS